MGPRLVAEALGTALLLYVVVGSGIAAETLGGDPAVQLLAHALVVGTGLAALIASLSGVSGAHLNPAVTLGIWRTRGMSGAEAWRYVAAQLGGGIIGVIAANLSFEHPLASIATTARDGLGRIGAEAVSTFVLVLLILILVGTGRVALVPASVGAWVAAIIFATSSTGFANPAVTVSRIFTDTYTGIAPTSVAGFLGGQLAAALAAAPLSRYLLSPSPDPQIQEKRR